MATTAEMMAPVAAICDTGAVVHGANAVSSPGRQR